jgi:hypothetical protein
VEEQPQHASHGTEGKEIRGLMFGGVYHEEGHGTDGKGRGFCVFRDFIFLPFDYTCISVTRTWKARKGMLKSEEQLSPHILARICLHDDVDDCMFL